MELPAHDPGCDPERVLLSSESRAAIGRALDRVPFRYRAALVMRDIEGLSYDEIAAGLDIGLGTVKSRIARGRESLRRHLVEELA